MPAVRILGSSILQQAPHQGLHLAVAVMAANLSRFSEAPSPNGLRKRSRTEKTRPGNPNRLALNLHVFPKKSIERFTDRCGLVAFYDISQSKVSFKKANNVFFCASRAWSHNTEANYMRRIEDGFQRVVSSIVDDGKETLAPEHKPVVDKMYALWYMRSRYRDLEDQEIELNGVTGFHLSKTMEENLEKNGCLFARKGGRMPARQLNGLQIEFRTNQYSADLARHVTRWGVISAESGEFIVPDVPSHGIIPLTPSIALIHSTPDGVITERNLSELNQVVMATSVNYFFARDFSKCPLCYNKEW